MRNSWIVLLIALIALAAVMQPALAQTAGTGAPGFTWASLSPGNDWSAQVIQSIFPVTGTTSSPGTSPGQETTVIQQIIGQFTSYVAAIACAFVAYTVIMHIHRAAESSRILGQGQSWMFVVRVGFAGMMMFPVNGGFSAGQALVMQAAMTGIGMAKAVYTNAIQAVGPDAAVIATPMIPGTQQIVAGLIDNELCMALVNIAGNTGAQNLVPPPAPTTIVNLNGVGSVVYRYSFSSGNAISNPVCGTVTVQTPPPNQGTLAGVSVNMAAVQQAVLGNVISQIRPQVGQVAQNLWTTKSGVTSLAPLQAVYTGAVATYTNNLTSAATSIAASINRAVQANAVQMRNGQSDLLQNEVQASTLGWTGAGAYYLSIAKLNASTLSLMNAVPTTTEPTYAGLGPALANDLAAPITAAKQFMTTMDYMVQTQDGSRTPSGSPFDLSDAKSAAGGSSILNDVAQKLNFTPALFQSIARLLLPTTSIWTDPFGGLMALGQMLINTSLAGLGTAAVLSSDTLSTGVTLAQVFTGNIGGAVATFAGNAVIQFLGVPIFLGLLAMLIPGLMIAYVLPMVPYVMWMAGVAGWIILVCEAMVAVPLWMLAHMTVGGDGLHGRAVEGWSLLFSVVFRPTLMVIGLFLGYFVFDCMSWLIRETFGVAVGFVLQGGWLVTNLIGLVVLLSMFVMIHVVAAFMSFRLVAILPHHLPRMIGFTSANRVDAEDFMQRAAWQPMGVVAATGGRALKEGAKGFGNGMKALSGQRGGARLLSGSGGIGQQEGMDSTLSATTGTRPQEGNTDDV